MTLAASPALKPHTGGRLRKQPPASGQWLFCGELGVARDKGPLVLPPVAKSVREDRQELSQEDLERQQKGLRRERKELEQARQELQWQQFELKQLREQQQQEQQQREQQQQRLAKQRPPQQKPQGQKQQEQKQPQQRQSERTQPPQQLPQPRQIPSHQPQQTSDPDKKHNNPHIQQEKLKESPRSTQPQPKQLSQPKQPRQPKQQPQSKLPPQLKQPPQPKLPPQLKQQPQPKQQPKQAQALAPSQPSKAAAVVVRGPEAYSKLKKLSPDASPRAAAASPRCDASFPPQPRSETKEEEGQDQEQLKPQQSKQQSQEQHTSEQGLLATSSIDTGTALSVSAEDLLASTSPAEPVEEAKLGPADGRTSAGLSDGGTTTASHGTETRGSRRAPDDEGPSFSRSQEELESSRSHVPGGSDLIPPGSDVAEEIVVKEAPDSGLESGGHEAADIVDEIEEQVEPVAIDANMREVTEHQNSNNSEPTKMADKVEEVIQEEALPDAVAEVEEIEELKVRPEAETQHVEEAEDEIYDESYAEDSFDNESVQEDESLTASPPAESVPVSARSCQVEVFDQSAPDTDFRLDLDGLQSAQDPSVPVSARSAAASRSVELSAQGSVPLSARSVGTASQGSQAQTVESSGPVSARSASASQVEPQAPESLPVTARSGETARSDASC
ncbi:unnamed protein product [Polarella glacialis]|uniref:Uncharacterized protein n=1 Tax=Polarella glacialis TaxID=89957 RepID=A0A813G9C6_POLGL|nr:unnamed protein product [Polarella glacialis]